MHIVWFKRDLRIYDHEALAQAAKRGPVLPLYILEPDLWHQPDMSYRHYLFLQDCLSELSQALGELGQKLIIKVGNAVGVLEELHECHSIEILWSHQETWNGWTYARDKAVKRWCKSHNILWHEPVQNGVVRRLDDRDGWAARWYHQMTMPLIDRPLNLKTVKGIPIEVLPRYDELNLRRDISSEIQKGGCIEGLKALNSFLYERGEKYTKEMSSPVTAFASCSRLSAYLAFGALSMREVFQACEKRNHEIKQMPRGQKGKWPSAMRSFLGRLRWHCHFIQKLEDEPRIEFENMHPAYDGLRENDFNNDYFEAWKSGMTGYTMIDACIRALTATGWLNFRMRAMVMSFASYHLWLHWRKPALHLANLFTDYEPGIHYSQVQMQSGTTGINAIRTYNPIKQGVDQDPEGVFIRHWIPELREMDQEFIHTPWQAASQMNGYPMPIIDEKTARKAAADELYGLRKNNTTHKEVAKKIVSKHGSRKSSLPRTAGKKKIKNVFQGELPL
ncbi:FAD-binding domain-containing protein [Rickettsiaceae bacterium]|nr:FAD-binding domain-containing protein [Rickettsiaceae bacterium]